MGQDATTLFSGTFERSMDAKKRVAVPAGWLEKDGDEVLHVIQHPNDNCLSVMPPAELARQQSKIEASAATPAQKRVLSRRLYGDAQTVVTDKQGRVLLSEDLCQHARLNGSVVFVGSGRRFEIWSKEGFQKMRAETDDEGKRLFAETIDF